MNPWANFDRAAAAVTKIMDAVRPEQLGPPTACTEWDVRAVINHLERAPARSPAAAGNIAAFLGREPAGTCREGT